MGERAGDAFPVSRASISGDPLVQTAFEFVAGLAETDPQVAVIMGMAEEVFRAEFRQQVETARWLFDMLAPQPAKPRRPTGPLYYYTTW